MQMPAENEFVREMVCINCPLGCMLTVKKAADGTVSVAGNTCPKGEQYGQREVTDPRRIVTSTVSLKGRKDKVLSVKTKEAIPKDKIWECMEALKKVEAVVPVRIGDVILENVAGTGVDIVATKEESGE